MVTHSISLGHGTAGNSVAANVPPTETMQRTTYTSVPPSRLCSTDRANRDVAPAGPIARMMDAMVCARPVVAPSAERVGTAVARKIKIASDPTNKKKIKTVGNIN